MGITFARCEQVSDESARSRKPAADAGWFGVVWAVRKIFPGVKILPGKAGAGLLPAMFIVPLRKLDIFFFQ